MIPRVRLGAHAKDYPGPLDGRALFDPQRPLRELRILVDADLLHAAEPWSAGGLLAGLLTHELIQLYRFADDGPPPDVPQLEVDPLISGRWYEGWAVLGNADVAVGVGLGVRPVSWVTATGYSNGSIWGNATDVAAADERTDAYREFPAEEAALRRERDALAAQVAETIQADIFITERPYLHALRWSLARNVTFMRPDEALPFVGLYLRTQGEFIIWKAERGRETYNRGLFYWVGARELLPQGWRWFTACLQHDQHEHQDRLVYLGQSALQRVQRALELRDQVHRALNRPQNNDVAEDALLAFDSCLVFLMGALDVTARVAHLALGLTGRIRDAGWQRTGWLRRVEAADAALAALLAEGTPGDAVLKVLTALRNTVHSAGLSSVGMTTRLRERERTLINLSSGVDAADMESVLAAIDVLGGRDAWAIETLLPDRYFADPGILLERIFVPTLALLNELMAKSPMENLAGVALTSEMRQPPQDRDRIFDERKRQSIRLQLGL